ncbi:MAG TPA: hypothetical protein VG477_15665 [Thermoanaerobaculia bacterium]|nr:hypothetical protein [Thermoanaerobaculia bacterium]
MKRWWLVIALLLSVGLNLGIFAAFLARRAGPPPERLRPGREAMADRGVNPLPRLPRLADRLGLEGEKRRRFLELQWKLFEESSRLRLQLGEVHREIKREMVQVEPDRQRIESLLQESAKVYLNLERSLTRNILATRELLDDRQEREYLALIGRIGIPMTPGGSGIEPRPQQQARPRARVEEERSGGSDRLQQREQRLKQWEEKLRQREERMREVQERLPERRRRRPFRDRFPTQEEGPPPAEPEVF